MQGSDEFRLDPKKTLQLVVFTVPTPTPEAYPGPVIKYTFPLAGLVKATETRVHVDALETVLLPKGAVSD